MTRPMDEVIKQAFEHSEFFSDFPKTELERLASNSAIRKFKKNSLLVNIGDDSHAAYLLLNGTANAFTDDEEGNEFIVNSFHSGDCFGELGVLDDLPRTANVITTSECECLVIPKVELMRAIESDHKVAMVVLKSLVGRIRGMTEDVSCLALMDVYGRIARVLNGEAVEGVDGIRKTGRMTHQELANKVGSSREMVSKIFKDLKTGGYIDSVDHCIVLQKNLPDRW